MVAQDMYEFAVYVDLWSADARVWDKSIGMHTGIELIRCWTRDRSYDPESPV
jgi:hypothetical protein